MTSFALFCSTWSLLEKDLFTTISKKKKRGKRHCCWEKRKKIKQQVTKMCLKAKNKYTYLSMCSSCNAVSKFSSIVKKHLLKQHKKMPETSVIPIRIENKFERKVNKTLDTANAKKSFMKKKRNPLVELKKNNSKKGTRRNIESRGKVNKREISRCSKDTVKCAGCDEMFNDCIKYIYHLVTTHSNYNIKVSFKCVYCHYTIQYVKDIQKHFEKKHDCNKAQLPLIDCINIEIAQEEDLPSQNHCPYCDLDFDKVHNLNNHVRDTHQDNIENLLIPKQDPEVAENQSQQENDLLIVFRCPSCPESFHTVLDICEHIKARHAPNIAYSKPKRKRKQPKWMEDDFEEIPVKKPNNINSDKDSQKLLVSSKMVKKCTKGVSERKCAYCNHVAKTEKALAKHFSVFHPDQKFKAPRTDAKAKETPDTEQVLIDDKNAISKNSHPLTVDMLTFDRDAESAISENSDGKLGTRNVVDIENGVDDKDSESFGDSDDDFVPDNSDTDSELSVTEDGIDTEERLRKVKGRHVKRSVNEQYKGTAVSEKFTVRYECPFCGLNLHNYEYIRYHVVQCHPEITNFKVNTKEMVKTKLIDGDNWESFKCPNPKCDVAYKKKQSLIDHMATCERGKFRKEKIVCTLPRAWMEKFEKSVSVICPYCQSVKIGKTNLEKHLQEHYPDKVFEIELNNTLSSQQIKTDKWSELECVMCPYCDVVATKKIQLSKHIKRFHSNEICTDVVSCILVNKSASKDKARLIIKDIENLSLARKKNELSETPETLGRIEENTVEKSIEHATMRTIEIDKNTESVSLNEVVNDSCGEQLEHTNSIPSARHRDSEELQGGKELYEIIFIQSAIPCGMYICPVCEFKTGIKKDIKSHMNKHNSKCHGDIDSIYTIPDSWIKMDEGDSHPFQCQLCDHKDVNLTLAFRHVLNNHKDITVNEPHSNPHISESLFEILNVEVEGVKEKYEKEKYRCTACVPGHIFRSKNGLQRHLKTRHTDSDSIIAYETMYKMLDLISDSCNTRQIIICLLCKKEIWDFSDLEKHFNQNHPEKLNELLYKLNKSSDDTHGSPTVSSTCEVCCKLFMDEKSLKHHLILHMNKYKPTCTLCNICFTNHPELECHNMEVHAKAGEMCYICGVTFSSVAKLDRHLKWHETGECSSIKALCQYCGTTLMGKNMKKHLVDKHINEITCACNICATQNVPDGKRSVKCDQCKAVFCTWYVLRAHQYKEHDVRNGKPFKCRSCYTTFLSRREQTLHSHSCGKLGDSVQTHFDLVNEDSAANYGNVTEITVSEQANIDFNLGLAYVKQEYISVDKQSEQPYSCKLCGKGFTKMRYICNHLRRMHTRDETKRFRCKICKMGFNNKQDFGKHCRSHIGLRQYQCKVCLKMYKTAAHLKEHTEIHTQQTYTCEYCGLEFKQRGALLAHVVHHDKVKPLKCLYCNKGYTTHGDLQRHMNSYSKSAKVLGAKQLTFCNYCSKDFPNHISLVKHFQIHLPVNPFQCSVCQSKFATFREMYNHKSRKEHFTDLDKEEGKQDLHAPGNRFRRYQVSKSKKEISKTNKISMMEDPVGDNALSVITDDENIIEIEIGSSVAECDDRAKTVIQMFENDVIKSMLDADPEILETVEFHDTDSGARKDKQLRVYSDQNSIPQGYQFEMQEGNSYQTDTIEMQDMYVTVRHDAYSDNNITSADKPIVDSPEKLASNQQPETVPETVPGKTQTFQSSDGSIIHVCVINPDK